MQLATEIETCDYAYITRREIFDGLSFCITQYVFSSIFSNVSFDKFEAKNDQFLKYYN